MKYALLLVLCLVSISGYSQSLTEYWQDTNPQARSTSQNGLRYGQLDLKAFKNHIEPTLQRGSSSVISLPLPDGTSVQVSVQPTQVMAPALAAKFPGIHTFAGRSIDGEVTFRGDITHKGFHGQLFTPHGTVYIDPAPTQGESIYLSYDRMAYMQAMPKKTFTESTVLNQDIKSREGVEFLSRSQNAENAFAGTARTYRLAVATTGEYTSFHGGTVEDGMAGIVTTFNRVNGIYERDLSITFELIADNDQLVFTNASSDPYNNSDAFAALDQNQAHLDDVIGSENYDIGHLLSTGSGGLAAFRSTCDTGTKAQGTTGTSTPEGDSFDVDYVAHEIGHQMGAVHTFNGTQGLCSGGNRTGSGAFEPGSGSTIMAYANICGSDNIQAFSDDYFHHYSLVQISTFVTEQNGATCATTSGDGNTAPEVIVPDGGWTIPANTPFRLQGSGTDVDNDDLTYAWEQNDLGPGGAPNSPSGNAPIFRSYLPEETGERWFPRKADVLAGTSTFGELLPTYNRSLDFTLTVRDNQGGINFENVSFEVDTRSAPFVVISPQNNDSYGAGSVILAQWDEGVTNLAPYSVSNVQIDLSLDGGNTWSVVLSESTPNDGIEYVTIPEDVSASSNAKLRVSALENIFFNVNTGTFSITAAGTPDFLATVAPVPLQICAPDEATLEISTAAISGFTSDITVSTSDLPSNLTATFASTTLSPGESTTLTIGNTASVSGDNLSFNVVFSGGGITRTLPVPIEITPALGDAITGLSPANNETSVDVMPTFRWTADEAASFYLADLATDEAFTNIIATSGSTVENSWTPSVNLDGGTEYFWRVQAASGCGTTDYSTAKFKVISLSCSEFTPQDLPITITTAGNAQYVSNISIQEDLGLVYSAELLNLDITHSYIQDLDIALVAPNEEGILLQTRICSSEDNEFISFSDAGAPYTDIPCPPIDGGTYQPAVPFSNLRGYEVQGTWTLLIRDAAEEDGGSLNAWTLKVCYANSDISLSGTLTDDSTASLSWTPETTENIVNWEIWASENDGGLAKIGTVGVGTLTYVDEDLDRNTTYSYRVRAEYNDGSFGDFSNTLSLTTPDVPPLAPSGLLVTSTLNFQTEMTWQDNSDNEAGFIIQRAEGTSESFVTIDSTVADRLSYVDAGLAEGAQYSYRVAAYNSAGNSDWSEASQIVVTDLPFGIEETLRVFPNPSQGALSLSLDGTQASTALVAIWTPQGKQVLAQVWDNPTGELALDTQGLPSGLYVIKVETNEGTFTQSWIKQ